MNNFRRVLLLALLFAWPAVLPANAPPIPSDDRPRPKPVAKKQAKMIVTTDSTTNRSQLVIPEKVLDQITARKVSDNSSSTRTIFAGLAISLAVCGVFFLKRGGKTRIAALIVMGLGLVGGVSTYVMADIPGPFRPQPRPPRPDVGNLEIVVVKDGQTIELTLGRDDVRQLMQSVLDQAEGKNDFPPPPQVPGSNAKDPFDGSPPTGAPPKGLTPPLPKPRLIDEGGIPTPK